MAIVQGAMDILLPKLAELLTDEFKLQKGLKEEIASLSRELESMQAALVKISEVPVGQLDGQVKIWAKEVREMSYDIEDSIDSFTVRFGAVQEPAEPLGVIKGFMDRVMSLWTTALSRRQIATEIQRIKGEVEEVSQRRKRYKLGKEVARPCAATTIDPRLPALYEDVSKLVGIERPAGEIVKWLNEGEGASKQRLKVLSVVGVGGLGKTTLANTVYHMLLGQFQCRAFVSVSFTPDIKKIFCSILRQVSGEDCANSDDWDVKELVDHIRDFLKDKRYFIIIDDIWDQNVWAILKVALIESNCGSRIITTTRKVDVAESCCYGFNGRVYDLAPLSHEDSKKLFYKRIFHYEDEHPIELEEVSEKILKKCAGLPLAIITIASLLASKPTKTNELWYRVLNSIGSGHENSPSVENMRGILSLSYSDLPPHLKTCLLYLSIFPEDHMINRDKLIWRWIAEGFIHEKQRGNLYEQGENYFNELINRNMIQPVDTDTHGSAKTCHVHDMVLDLISSLATEENFVTILGGQQPLSVGGKIRRLSFQQKKGEHTMTETPMDLSHVRLLLVLRSAMDMIPSLLSFQVLRVLELEECQHLDSHLLKDITSLLHLRYLGLGSTYITEIPKEIGNLQWLQTLDLRETKINELPSSIVQLRQLVRLYVSIRTRVPAGIGNMRSLEELSRINISESPKLMKELGALTELRVLEIWANVWDKSYEDPIVESLSSLHKIQILSIFASDVSLDFLSKGWVPTCLRTFWAWDSPFSVLPKWINDSLQSLSIRVKKIQQKHVQILGGLPALHFLELLVTEHPEEKMVIGLENTFRCLTEFAFECRAAGLIVAQGSLQRLQRLRLDFGVRETKDLYGDFDFGLENLSSIRRVRIDIDCDGALVSEVESLEAVIRNTTKLHLTSPSINRRLEEDMLKDEDKQADGLANTKEENWPAKVGPWGGNGGRNRDIKVAPQRLETVTIRSGSVVDSVAFSYKDENGHQQTAGPWGSDGGNKHTIQLGPTEFVTQVSGTFGSFGALSNVLTSLTLVTNCGSYGPFGKVHGSPFQTTVKSNGSIVGFFGRAGQFVDALGVYVLSSSV
ncbi:disease resistance protein Pik-2-like [Lolium perenne]|uniref:disease resistance protein Pik-2-like n=1 Tax=Lolium perenne TaxID=4522 RepID=UPI0021F68945|nr:disease resistance protein PIK6-NP-like [Lolium perenne]